MYMSSEKCATRRSFHVYQTFETCNQCRERMDCSNQEVVYTRSARGRAVPCPWTTNQNGADQNSYTGRVYSDNVHSYITYARVCLDFWKEKTKCNHYSHRVVQDSHTEDAKKFSNNLIKRATQIPKTSKANTSTIHVERIFHKREVRKERGLFLESGKISVNEGYFKTLIIIYKGKQSIREKIQFSSNDTLKWE